MQRKSLTCEELRSEQELFDSLQRWPYVGRKRPQSNQGAPILFQAATVSRRCTTTTPCGSRQEHDTELVTRQLMQVPGESTQVLLGMVHRGRCGTYSSLYCTFGHTEIPTSRTRAHMRTPSVYTLVPIRPGRTCMG